VSEKAADITADGFRPEPVMRPRQQVENQLRAAILDGTFANGDKFPSEARLAEQFGVSRATIREALRSLSEAGLISTVPGAGGGSFVTYFDHHRLADFISERLISTLELGAITYEEVIAFRALIEVPAARLAAENRTEEHIEQLRAAIAESEATAVDDPRVYDIRADFHRIVGAAAGNRLLSTFIAATLRVTTPITHASLRISKLTRQVLQDHTALTDAIEKQDAEAAEELAVKHLDFLRSNAAYGDGPSAG